MPWSSCHRVDHPRLVALLLLRLSFRLTLLVPSLGDQLAIAKAPELLQLHLVLDVGEKVRLPCVSTSKQVLILTTSVDDGPDLGLRKDALGQQILQGRDHRVEGGINLLGHLCSEIMILLEGIV